MKKSSYHCDFDKSTRKLVSRSVIRLNRHIRTKSVDSSIQQITNHKKKLSQMPKCRIFRFVIKSKLVTEVVLMFVILSIEKNIFKSSF